MTDTLQSNSHFLYACILTLFLLFSHCWYLLNQQNSVFFSINHFAEDMVLNVISQTLVQQQLPQSISYDYIR